MQSDEKTSFLLKTVVNNIWECYNNYSCPNSNNSILLA